jgi:hypothetical protein
VIVVGLFVNVVLTFLAGFAFGTLIGAWRREAF